MTKLEAVLLKHGLSQAEVSRAADIADPTLRSYIQGTVEPTRRTMFKVVDAIEAKTGVRYTLDDLFGREKGAAA